MNDIIKMKDKQEILERIRRRSGLLPPVENAPSFADSIVLLLDISSSMEGRKIVDAKEALINFLNNINLSNYGVGLVTFGDDVYRFSISRDFNHLMKTIKGFSARGSTPMKAAIQSANDLVKNKTNPVMVITTDGEPTDASKDNILNYARTLKRRGVRMIVIGNGLDIDEKFLRNLASYAKDYHFAKESFQLKEIVFVKLRINTVPV